MSCMSRRGKVSRLMSVEVTEDLPSASDLRASLGEDVPSGLEPVSKLVRAMESAERDGRRPYLVSMPVESASMDTLIESMLPERPPAVPSKAAVLQARRNAQARLELLEEFGF